MSIHGLGAGPKHISDLTNCLIVFFEEVGLEPYVTRTVGYETIIVSGKNGTLEASIDSDRSPVFSVFYLVDPYNGPSECEDISMTDPASLDILKEWVSKIL